MSPCRRRAWCGRMGCITRRRRRPSRSAVPHLGNCRWRRPCRRPGRRCVPRVGRPIPSGVPPAGSCSCAPALSRAGVRHRLNGLVSQPEDDTRHAAGEAAEECGGVWRCLVVALRGQEAVWGAQRAQLRTTAPQGRLSGPVADGMAWGDAAQLHSASEHPVSGRIHTRGQSNQVRIRRSGLGVRPPRGSLPLSTPDSILICYQKSSSGQRRGVAQLLARIIHQPQNRPERALSRLG